MAEQKTPQDDKSINDLLKEYASDVKDKDLDDFLKDSSDDSFESAVEDDEEETEDEDVAVVEPRKSSAGILTMLFIVVAFGAAGAGAWMYLNRDEGMTAIMGGFMGNDDANAPASQLPPPPPLASAGSSPAPMDETSMVPPTPMPDAPAQPLPIMNEPMPTADAGAPTPGADVLSVPAAEPSLSPEPAPAPAAATATAAPAQLMEKAPAAAEPATPLPTAGADAKDAVSAWTGGETPANTDATAKLPEKAVEPVKAKPVAAPKAAKKTEPLMQNKDTAKAAAPKEYVSGMDGALTPPFVAIQAAKRNGMASPVAAPAAAPSPVTYAPAPTAAMKAVPPPFTPQQAQDALAAKPELRTVPLAINGGRSVPDNGTRAYAQIPDTDNGTAPARSMPADTASAPAAVSAPAQAQMPVASSQPTSTPTGNGPAAGLLAQAQSAESSGDVAKALGLYQQALEADAIYGDGKSIDRGAVYDRIGALKAR